MTPKYLLILFVMSKNTPHYCELNQIYFNHFITSQSKISTAEITQANNPITLTITNKTSPQDEKIYFPDPLHLVFLCCT